MASFEMEQKQKNVISESIVNWRRAQDLQSSMQSTRKHNFFFISSARGNCSSSIIIRTDRIIIDCNIINLIFLILQLYWHIHTVEICGHTHYNIHNTRYEQVSAVLIFTQPLALFSMCRLYTEIFRIQRYVSITITICVRVPMPMPPTPPPLRFDDACCDELVWSIVVLASDRTKKNI